MNIESLLPWLQSSLMAWGLPAIWLLVFFTGETGIIVTFALTAQGLLAPLPAIAFAFLGSLSADLFWYVVTTSTLRPWYEKRHQDQVEKKKEQSKVFMNLADRYPYTILTVLKFLAGLRLFLTIYILTRQKLPFHRYLFYTVIGNALFIAVLFPIGWFVGKGTSTFLDIEKKITFVIGILLFLNITSQLLMRLLQRIGTSLGSKSFSK